MGRIKLERPGGKKRGWRHPLGENQILLVFFTIVAFGVHFLTLLRYERGVTNSLSLLALAVVSGVLGMASYFYFLLYSYSRRKEDQVHLVSEFGPETVHCGPTLLGWIACGTDWIATSELPKDFIKIPATTIENFAWGDTKGKITSLIEVDPNGFKFPKILNRSVMRSYWIFVPNAENAVDSSLAFFRRESEMMKWVEIIGSLANGENLPAFANRQSASKFEIAKKSKALLIAVGTMYVPVMMGFYYAYFLHPEKSTTVTLTIQAVSFFMVFLAMMSSQGELKGVAREARFLYAGGEESRLDNGDLSVVNGHLVVVGGAYDQAEGVECIPVAHIREVALENWGHSFVDRDLFQLFKRDAIPISMVLRLYLDDGDDPEREIKLPTMIAERWYSELKGLIGQNPSTS